MDSGAFDLKYSFPYISYALRTTSSTNGAEKYVGPGDANFQKW